MEEHEFGKGGLVVERNPNIGQASAVRKEVEPFDWEKGFDIEDKVGKIPTKNQYGSFACGGNMVAYGAASLESVRDNKPYEEKSARYVYAQTHAVGGGTTETDLINLWLKKGVADEALVKSYKYDGTTDESFMTDKSDIDIIDDKNASDTKGLTPLYLDNLSFDELAATLRDNNGLFFGINGRNNGTWYSADPLPPVGFSHLDCWHHWIFIGKAKIRNGKKMFGLINSWGDNVGEDGWQWIDETYMPYIWCKWGMVIDHKPDNTKLNVDLKYGMKGEEVKKLQHRLQDLGFFPKEQQCTGYFGNITKNAVIAYQVKNNITPALGYVGIKTRTMLNKNIITSALESSDGTGNISTTVKSALIFLSPLLIDLLAKHNILVTQGQVTDIFNQVAYIIGALGVLWGALRKIYYGQKS